MRKFLLFSWAMMLTFAASFAQSVTVPQADVAYTLQHYGTMYLTWEADADGVHYFEQNYSDAQKFYFIPTGDEDTYYIQNVASGTYLAKNSLWKMTWLEELPADLTLVSFELKTDAAIVAVEGYVTIQNVNVKNTNPDRFVGVDKEGYNLTNGVGKAGDEVCCDKYTGRRASSESVSWLIVEAPKGFDFAKLDELMEEAAEAMETLGEEANGYADMADYYDFIDAEVRDTITSQMTIELLAAEFAAKIMDFRLANASDSYPVDVTQLYLGSLSTDGWQSEFSGGTVKITSNVKSGDYTGSCVEYWVPAGSGQVGRALYRVVELPRGNYTLRAAFMATNQTVDGDGSEYVPAEGAYLYANNVKESIASPNATSEYHTLNAYVPAGTLEFGLGSSVADANWFAMGDISLVFRGDNGSNEAMVQAVKDLIADADAAKELYIYTGLIDVIDRAIAQANAAIEADDADAMSAASSALSEAIAAAKSSQAAYESLAAKLAEADATELDEGEAAQAFVEAVEEQRAIYEAKSADEEGVAAAIAAIDLAVRLYLFSTATAEEPLDITSYLANADMEEGATGWIWISSNAHKTNAKTSSYAGFEGKVFLEEWVASSTSSQNSLADWDIYQTLTGMPAGTYSLTAYINACNQGYEDPSAVHGAELYANGEATPVATGNGQPKLFSVLIYNSSDTLRVGFRGVEHDINWWAWDNVTLAYCGNVDSRVDAERAILNGMIDNVAEQIAIAAEIKGDEPLQMPSAAFDALGEALDAAADAVATATSIDDLKAAEDALNEAFALFKATKLTAPDPRALYVLRNVGAQECGQNYVMDATGDLEGDAILNLNEYSEGNECQQFIFFAASADAPRPYHIMSAAGKFITLKGTNSWTMDLQDNVEEMLANASFDINWVAGTSYSLSTKSGYLGINDLAAGVFEVTINSPLYADKKVSSTLAHWQIEKVGTTGIESVNARNTAILLDNGRLTVVAAEPQAVSVYSLAGVRLSQGTTGTALDLSSAPAGVYIVKVGNGAVAKITKD